MTSIMMWRCWASEFLPAATNLQHLRSDALQWTCLPRHSVLPRRRLLQYGDCSRCILWYHHIISVCHDKVRARILPPQVFVSSPTRNCPLKLQGTLDVLSVVMRTALKRIVRNRSGWWQDWNRSNQPESCCRGLSRGMASKKGPTSPSNRTVAVLVRPTPLSQLVPDENTCQWLICILFPSPIKKCAWTTHLGSNIGAGYHPSLLIWDLDVSSRCNVGFLGHFPLLQSRIQGG
ncbi:hypothetical protein EDD16DRAFT_61353 [Pisolithus croceorrhizus]|nr:hypothetical protein EDD16DRAFT_61353 [Pisolithus croceorrhizus]